MQVQFVHAIVHTPEQVREILDKAIEIAEESIYPPDQWAAVFGAAVQLLGQWSSMGMAQQPPAMPLPRMDTIRQRH